MPTNEKLKITRQQAVAGKYFTSVLYTSVPLYDSVGHKAPQIAVGHINSNLQREAGYTQAKNLIEDMLNVQTALLTLAASLDVAAQTVILIVCLDNLSFTASTINPTALSQLLKISQTLKELRVYGGNDIARGAIGILAGSITRYQTEATAFGDLEVVSNPIT